MSNTAKSNNFRITRSLKLVSSVAGQLFRSAATSYAGRDYGMVKGFSYSLINCGLPAYAGFGHHFAGLAAFGHGDCRAALTHFEKAISLCPPCYRARVLLSIGSALGMAENDDSEYVKACLVAKSLSDPLARVQARQGLAIMRAKDGKHWQALDEIERLYHFVKGQNLLYVPADIANSYAEELRQVGKLEQAQEVIKEVKASPYFSVYPEWQETARGIDEAMPKGKLYALRSGKAVITKGIAYANLLATLKANYPSYTVEDLTILKRTALFGAGQAGG